MKNLLVERIMEEEEQGRKVPITALHQLTLDWNYTMQQLSSVFFTAYPVVLTSKLVSDYWHASARLMTAACALGSLWPGQPHMYARVKGTQRNYIENATSLTFPISFKANKVR